MTSSMILLTTFSFLFPFIPFSCTFFLRSPQSACPRLLTTFIPFFTLSSSTSSTISARSILFLSFLTLLLFHHFPFKMIILFCKPQLFQINFVFSYNPFTNLNQFFQFLFFLDTLLCQSLTIKDKLHLCHIHILI